MFKKGLFIALFMLLGLNVASAVDVLDTETNLCDYDTLQIYEGSAAFEPVWILDNYSITYNLDGGVVDGENPVNFNFETETFTLINPTKDGYVFIGWCEDSVDCENATTEYTIESGTSDSLDLYAVWSKQITVHFESNGTSPTSNTPADLICVQGQDCLQNIAIGDLIARDNYLFNNWNLLADGSSETSIEYQLTDDETPQMFIDLTDLIANTEDDEITLYAQWTPQTKTCIAGEYLEEDTFACVECTSDHYCPGGTLTFSESEPDGLFACDAGTFSEPGAKSSAECCASGYRYDEATNACKSIEFVCESGKYLHVGSTEKLCLSTTQKTHPAMAVGLADGNVYYLNMSPISEPHAMTKGTTKKMKMLLNNIEYYIYDDSAE